MSVIGPRPGLWNQDILTAERDKYGANDVKPGLTGWAQINGRDELEIPDKAKLDGEYVSKIGFGMDLKERWNTYRKALNLNALTSAWASMRYAVITINCPSRNEGDNNDS